MGSRQPVAVIDMLSDDEEEEEEGADGGGGGGEDEELEELGTQVGRCVC